MDRFIAGNNVRFYGDVSIGSNVIIENDVTIGHPSPYELKDFLSSELSQQSYNLEDIYQKCTLQKTTIGSSSIIRSGSIIYSGCAVGQGFDCGHHVVIRENTSIGDLVYVKPFTYIMSSVNIGHRCRIAGSVADYSTIGNDVSSFGILTHRRIRRYSELLDNPEKEPFDSHGPIIEDNCIIGRNATIVGNIRLSHGSVVGANTFVNFDVASGSKVLGFKGREASS